MLLIQAKDQCFVASFGSTPVSGVGEVASVSRTSDESLFWRDAQTHTRDGRAPRVSRARLGKYC